MLRFVRPLLLGLALLLTWGLAPAQAQSDKYTFVAYGDTRSQPDVHRRIIAEIVKVRPEFVVQSGDLVANGRNKAQWTEFDQITQPLRDAHIGYYPARGNHDIGAFFTARVREPLDSGNKLYYAFTRHHNRFIVLDEFEDYDPASPQYHWLETELIKAKKTAINTFVMFHESPYSVGPHGPTLEAQKYLHPLFVKYPPRAVITGHDHLFYRTVRDGVNYIVTGGGGAPLYDFDNKQIAIPGDVYIKQYHIVKMAVSGPRVTCTVLGEKPDQPGQFTEIDHFTLGPK